LVISNIDELLSYYKTFISYKVSIGFGPFILHKSLVKFVNNGLMAIFFFFLGLEMKYHIIEGEFRNKKALLLPTITAMGGFIVPALIYTAFNYHSPEGQVGWAIPVATDTAFVLAILALMKSRINDSVKIFVIGLSIIDDVLAVLTLTIFYTPELDVTSLIWCVLPLIYLFALNWTNSSNKNLYYFGGVVLWILIVKTGIHGTIAGILLAFFIPTRIEHPHKTTHLVKEMEASIHTLVAFIILPLFAFVNCELPLKELNIDDMFSSISMGCCLGWLIGKPLGIFSFMMVGRMLNYIELPKGVGMTQFLGIACLCGVGFTLSLFIGLQAFDPIELENQMKVGVLLASACSIIIGVYIIKCSTHEIEAVDPVIE
jgi:NhaA family Na+:H+ antiporter